jgi:hypothetical protein
LLGRVPFYEVSVEQTGPGTDKTHLKDWEISFSIASVLRRANVAKPLRVSALLTSQHTGGTSECN